MKTIGFIGAGNMGGALATAACHAGYSANVLLYDKDGEKAKALAKTLSCRASTLEAVAECDMLFLGVKPQFLAALANEVAPLLKTRGEAPVLVSMAAGVTLARLNELFGDAPIIRIMPNMPVAAGAGMIVYCHNDKVCETDVADFLAAMREAGKLDAIPERMIDAASAVSGCGPAFVDLFIEALADGGVRCGLPRDKAMIYAEQTVLGAAKYALESGIHPAALKDAVCSPGGSTIEGVRTLEAGSFRSLTIEAVTAAFEKTKALGKN